MAAFEKRFLPIDKEDMKERGIAELDFIFVSGDAYVDHPSFGPAIICRLLEKRGYSVGIIAQPDWRRGDDFRRLGKPRLGFLVSAGNMDSMLSRFTAAKKMRGEDAYSPGGAIDRRPKRAVIVYANKLREVYPDVPIIIGGIEASLRRFAHYDYWSNSVRRSVLADCAADLLVYGMGEKAVLQIAAELNRGIPIDALQDVKGTCFKVPNFDYIYDYEKLPSFDEVSAEKEVFAAAFKTEYEEQDPIRGKRLAQQNGDFCIVQNPPSPLLTEAEMDEIYDLPYQRTYHPIYEKEGGVPAIKEVEFSITCHRGCFGGCNFCAIVSHQGRIIQRRSKQSIVREAKLLTKQKGFKGYIHDVGGPTANFHRPACDDQLKRGACKKKQCLFPKPCEKLIADHSDYLAVLRELRKLPGVKKVFIRSGIRYDYLLHADDDFLSELCRYHVSGQLKVAPEHIAPRVTRLMGKSGKEVFVKFAKKFEEKNRSLGLKQYLVPYFMSSHPGASLADAVDLAEFIHGLGYRPQQVQDFIPTPGTVSTCMYWTGLDPLTGKRVYSAKSVEDKARQRALLQYWNPKKKELVREALKIAKRTDLIGTGKKCLVSPEKQEGGQKKNILKKSNRRRG